MIAIIDERMPLSYQAELERRGFDIVSLPPFPKLAAPVASHPDMLVFLSKEHLITHSEYYQIARSEIDQICARGNFKLLLSDEPMSSEYPHDIIFNAAHIGTYVLGKASCASRYVLKICEQFNFTFIDVKQGYAKCSVCIVDDDAIITADESIARAASKHNIDVLKIAPGHVRLDGYDTGFIGGASGKFGNTIYFCGNIDSHPCASDIRDFCAKHKKNIVSSSNGELFDVGTIFFI